MGPSQFPSSKKPSLLRWLPRILTYIVFVLVVGLLFIFRQNIIDQIVVLTYQTSSDVSAIAENIKLTEKGMFYLKASRTEINSSEDFNRNCQRKEINSIILGCYSGMKIFVYDVKNDERLKGVMSVTTAHELLHAAWDRLGVTDKNKITTLLYVEYNNKKTSELVERMEYYVRQQPGDEVTELHSIVGTEFRDLDPELENYYNRYFLDRSLLVDQYENYSKVFADLAKRQAELKTEIDRLAESINKDTLTYNNEVANINTLSNQLFAKRSSVDLNDINAVNQFNSELKSLEFRINALDSFKQSIEANRNLYESKANEFNSLVVTGNTLTTNLDSTLEPVVECRLFSTTCESN